jgi:hypothetical protein
MSGDFFTHNNQQPPLPEKFLEKCRASIAMDEIKADQIQKIFSSININKGFRTGSPLQE